MGDFKPSGFSGENDTKKIKDYLFMLNEQLRYMFNHLDPEDNFSDDAFRKYIKNGEDIAYLEMTAKHLLVSIKDAEGNISILEQTSKSLTSRISDAEGNVSILQQTANSLTSRIGDAEGNISVLQQTSTSLTSRIGNAEGSISVLQQTATSITSRISDAEGNISVLKQTSNSLTSRISNAEGDISIVEQTAKKINWVVASGTSAANFTLTSRMASVVAEAINLSGYVTFNSLSSPGATTINGNNVKTGTLDAMLLTIGGDKVFGSVDGRFKMYKDFVPSNLSLSQLSVNTISVVNGPTIRGSYGDLSLGISYDYGKISSSATEAQIIAAVNHIIDWIKRVD